MTGNTNSPPVVRYSGLAVVSLILGVLSLAWFAFGLAWGTLGFIAVLAGRRARTEIARGPEELEGRALAMGGIVTGAVGFITSLFLLSVIVINAPS
jgi:hypothetical protein